MDYHEIHHLQGVNLNDFGDRLTFPLAPPPGQSLHVYSKISQYLLYGLKQNIPTHIYGSQTMYPNDIGESLTFHDASL